MMLQMNPNTQSGHIEAGQLHGAIGQCVNIHGVIYQIREMRGFAFVLLQTKRQLVQCVWSPEAADFPLSTLACNLAVIFRAKVMADPRSCLGCELRLLSVTLLNAPQETPVVINKKQIAASLDTLLDYRPITLRNNCERAIFAVQAGLCRGFREFLEVHEFMEIHSPKLVASGAEGGANSFALDYFGQTAYLAQSPQCYKQMMVGVFERVFEIGPVFRAEKHRTARHVNEYTGIDLEMGFIERFTELMAMETAMICHALEVVQTYCAAELETLGVTLPQVQSIPAVTFARAKDMVAQSGYRAASQGDDLEPEEERRLCDLVREQGGGDFVFVTHYPSAKRPFYAMDTPEKPEVTESFDLLFRGVEVTTGGQRIHDYDQQVEKMHRRGIDIVPFEGYLMAHKHGLPPHGGLGIGLERLTAQLLGLPNIRRATLFPRDTERLTP